MMTVRDVMTTDVITVQPTDLLKDVAQTLVERRISGVPVVDRDGLVVGVVSEADFLIKQEGPEGLRPGALDRVFGESPALQAAHAKLAARTAEELMTSPPITIEAHRPVSEAARMMTLHRVNRLPVVDDGRIAGIVTRADLVRAFARSDRELAQTIREDVLLRVLSLDPATFVVTVDEGVASVQGSVDRRSTAQLLRETVAMVPGIVEVDARVDWSFDDSRLEPATRDAVFPHGIR
jgi:CBS domain-containing protein